MGSRSWAICAAVALITGYARAEEPKEPKTEPRVVPVVGGSSDIGIGGGAMGSVARLEPGRKPYVYRLEASAIVTVLADPSGVRVPYQDYKIVYDVPEVLPDRRMRVELRPSFTNEQLWWYGLGNASQYVPTWEQFDPSSQPVEYRTERRRWQYERLHAEMRLQLRYKLLGNLFAQFTPLFSYNRIDALSDSKLVRDMEDPALREELVGNRNHAVLLFEHALVWDSRNDEIHPSRGMWHKVGLRHAPGGTEPFPYAYGGVGITLRFYAPLSKRFVLATRVIGDLLFGDVPFWELPRFDDGYAIGGAYGVRGVPAQRYAGKVKVFGNLELRMHVTDFSLFGSSMKLGLATFVDAGRLWTELRPRPELDGTGLGLKYGIGLGPRLGWGESFVIRGDVAWSPDARPVGVYFGSSHLF